MDLHELPATPFKRHPWEVARARFFCGVTERSDRAREPLQILDVGAGDGYLAERLLVRLPSGSRVTCLDALYTDDDLRQFSSAKIGNLTFTRQAPEGQFDLVLLLDVIEHVEDDRAFLRKFVASSLKPGGLVLISVPAWQELFSQHDVELKHYRRYSPAAAQRLITDCDLKVVAGGGLFHSLLVPRCVALVREAIGRGLGRHGNATVNLGQWNGSRLLSSVVERALSADSWVSHAAAKWNVSLPGLSYWALCEKA